MPLAINNQNRSQNAQFQQFVDFVKSGAGAELQGAPDRVPYRMFFGQLLAAKLDPRDIQNLHDALPADAMPDAKVDAAHRLLIEMVCAFHVA